MQNVSSQVVALGLLSCLGALGAKPVRGGELGSEAGSGGAVVAQDGAPSGATERTDLLTFARGVLFVKQTGLATGTAGAALLAVNGDPYRLGIARDDKLPVEFIYKLPANTTFDRFAIPSVVEQPGNVTFVKSVTVSGSLEGPDEGYRVLTSFELETHGPDEQVTEQVPDIQTPVRWLKIRFDGGINIVEGEQGRTNIWFSELIGNGTQEAVPLSTAFDGVWDLRLTKRQDLRGVPLQLSQDGATITGCYGDHRLTGSVNGPIARAIGKDPRTGRSSAFVFVADEDGAVHASLSINKGLFGARTAVVDPDLDPGSSPCAADPPEPVACGTNVYVNFAINSAAILPESEQVLADVYAQLVEEGAPGCRSWATPRRRVRRTITSRCPSGARRRSSTTLWPKGSKPGSYRRSEGVSPSH